MFKFLRERERGKDSTKDPFVNSHKLYKHIYPKYTTYNTTIPDINIRKISPCGKYLISFSMNQHGIAVYDYTIPTESNGPSPQFTDFFQKRYERLITSGVETLSFDFCLFSCSKLFMVLASALPTRTRQQRNPDCLNLSNLDDVTFWVIELATGEVTDKINYHSDFIFLTNHAGVHLYKDYLSITSVEHQCIYIHLFTESGKLVKELELGYYTFQDDPLFLSKYESGCSTTSPRETTENVSRLQYVPNTTDHQVPSPSRPINYILTPTSIEYKGCTGFLGGLKHRIMTFLYRQAKERKIPGAMNHFHLMFSYFVQLVMWRCQFLDSDNLIIKFGSAANVVTKTENQSQIFFVFYCISKSEVFGVFDTSSQELLDMLLQYDFLRGCSFVDDPFMGISVPSNSSHAKNLVLQQIMAVRNSKNGGALMAIRRVLSLLPINPQCYNESPYFDLELFSFDEKVVGSAERPRPCSEFPCKFFDRETGAFRFKLDTNIAPFQVSHNQKYIKLTRRQCKYFFHPTEPFALSVQDSPGMPSCVNIHCWFRFDQNGGN